MGEDLIISKIVNWVRIPGNRSRALRLGRESTVVFLGQSLAMAGGFLGVRVLTETLSCEIYGQLAILMSVIGLVKQIWGMPLGNTCGRFYAVCCDERRVKEFCRGVCGYLLLTGGILFVTAAGAVLFTGVGRVVWPSAIIAMSICADIMFSSVQNTARNRAVVAWHCGMAEWLRFSAAALLIWLFGESLLHAAWGYAVGFGIVALSQMLFFYRLTRHGGLANSYISSAKIMRKMWRYGRPLIAGGFFLWILNFADRLALRLFASEYDIGLYFSVYQLGFIPMALFACIVSSIVSPLFFVRAGTGADHRRIGSVLKANSWIALMVIASTIGCFFCAFFLHSWVFRFVVAADYSPASIYWPWLILTGGLYGTAQTFILSLTSTFRSGQILGLNVVASFVGIACYFGGAWLAGLRGVVMGSCIYAAIYCGMAAVLHFRLLMHHRAIAPKKL